MNNHILPVYKLYYNAFRRFRYIGTALLSILLILVSSVASAQSTIKQMETSVIFHINRYDIDPELGDNTQSIKNITGFIEKAAKDSIAITKISFCGYASPDGLKGSNKTLAQKRMNAMKNVIIRGGKLPNFNNLDYKSDVINISILKNLIETSDIPSRQQALDILYGTAPSSPSTETLNRLKQAANGLVWNDIKPLLAQLRYASVSFTYTIKPPALHAISLHDTISTINIGETTIGTTTYEPIRRNMPILQPAAKRNLYLSVKTNMLNDILLIPSIGAEAYLGKMSSINANWSYAWWKSDYRHNYWRYYGGDISLRRWFGKQAANKPLTGHHIGIYAQILTYDFELGGNGEMGNKYNYGGGLEYGFSLPVRRRLNIDFTLGIGYIGGEYYEYKPIDGHYVWQSTKRRNWFGPTKAEISLVWLIGHGNCNIKKGGNR